MSTDFGPAASDIDSAHLYQLIVENARETVLLADQSKFNAPSLFRIARWEQVSKVVTESEPDQAWKQFFKAQDIGLIYPSGEK
jgi:DeoR/GlpR family transcriptional regulator of sugar metabolism